MSPRVRYGSWSRQLTLLVAVLGLVSVLTAARVAAAAQEKVHFLSLDDHSTMLDGYLFRQYGEGRHPALVFLHGCGGLLTKRGTIQARETDWAAHLTAWVMWW